MKCTCDECLSDFDQDLGDCDDDAYESAGSPGRQSSCASFKSLKDHLEEECDKGRTEYDRGICCISDKHIFSPTEKMELMEEESLFSFETVDLKFLEKFKCLVQEEQKLTRKIKELEKQNWPTNKRPCDAVTKGSGKSYTKQEIEETNSLLRQENQNLKSETERAQKQTNCSVCKMKSKLPSDSTCLSTADDPENDPYLRRIKQLQKQLKATCENMRNMDLVNQQLKQELCALKAQTTELNKNIPVQPSQEEDDGVKEAEELHTLSCEIEVILEQMENCVACQCIPTTLKKTMCEIKNLADLVYSHIPDEGWKRTRTSKGSMKRSETDTCKRKSINVPDIRCSEIEISVLGGNEDPDFENSIIDEDEVEEEENEYDVEDALGLE